MTYPPPPLEYPGTVDASGAVIADVPCRKCGYNLRGLRLDGRCPECGRAVGLSVQGDLLRFSDPTWLRTLQRGARLIIWGVVAIVFGAIFTGVLTAAVPNFMFAGPAVIVFGYALTVIGSWLLTEPDPSGIGEDRYGTARKLIRITLILGLIDSAIDVVLLSARLSPQVTQPLTAVQYLIGIGSIVGIVAQLRYLRQLALRIPDTTLAGRAGFLGYAMGITFGIMMVLEIAARVLGATAGPPGAASAVLCIIAPLGIGFLVFAVMFLFLIERLGKRFGEEARVAEQTWARLDATTSTAPVA